MQWISNIWSKAIDPSEGFSERCNTSLGHGSKQRIEAIIPVTVCFSSYESTMPFSTKPVGIRLAISGRFELKREFEKRQILTAGLFLGGQLPEKRWE